MALEAAQVRVEGRVQGVGFRYFTRQAAQEEAITGWVRNAANGDVEVFAQGEPDALERFIAKLHRGPALAHVSQVHVSRSTPSETYRTFGVRH